MKACNLLEHDSFTSLETIFGQTSTLLEDRGSMKLDGERASAIRLASKAASGCATLLDRPHFLSNRHVLLPPTRRVGAGSGKHPVLLERLRRLPSALTVLSRGNHE